MGMNGSGVFVVNSAGQPVVATTLITAAAFNAYTADAATALSTAIMKDGQTTLTQNIPFNNKKITGLAAATARTDGASLATIQDGTGVHILAGSVAGSADAILLTASPAITAYAQGQWFRFIAGGTNTTAVTVNVNGVGIKDIQKNGIVALQAGDIVTSYLITIVYDGTRFRLLQPEIKPDSVFRISGSSDVTKLVAFEADGLTTASTRTVTVPDRSLTIGPVVTAEQATTAGTTIDFTGIPAGTKRITVMLVGVSTNGTSGLVLQLGDAGGVETTGYSGAQSQVLNAAATGCFIGFGSVGFIVASPMVAAGTYSGRIVLDLQNATTNTWVISGIIARLDTAAIFNVAGSKATSAVLDRVRLTSVTPDTFDAGAASISYE